MQYRILKMIQRKMVYKKTLNDMTSSDLEDMVLSMNVTYNETEDIMNIKYIGPEVKSFSFPQGIFEVREI